MVQIIENPDGSIAGEFPDDASPEEITQALNAELGVRRPEGVSDQSQDAPTPLGSARAGQPSSGEGGRVFDRPAGGPTPLERLGGAAIGTARVGAEIGAAFVPGLAAVRLANLAVKVAPRVGKALQAVTVFSKGGGFKGAAANIMRAIGGGAAGGAATEAIMLRDPVRGANFGAAGGPVGLGIGVAAKTVKAFMADPGAKGLIAIAKKLKMTPNEVGESFLNFKAVMGRNPSIAEIADDQAIAEINSILRRTASATAIAREGVESISKTRAGEFAGVVSGGRVTTTVAAQKARQKARGDVQFAEVRKQDIEFSADEVEELLLDTDFRANIPSILKRQLDEAIDVASFIDDAGDVVVGDTSISGKLVDDFRQVLGDAAREGKGFRTRFLDLKREIEDVARRQSPEFAQALDEFAARGARAEGVKAGRKLITDKTSEALAVVEGATTADFSAGLRVGARSGLEDVAQESLSRAGKLAQDLSRDEGLVGRLSAVLRPSELAALQRAGVAETKAIRNLGNVAPAIKAKGGAVVDNAIKAAVGAVAIGATNVGGAFKVAEFNALTNMLPKLLSKKARDSLARDILNPAKSKAVLSALKNLKLRDSEILDLFATSFAAGSQAAQAGQ